MTIHFSDLDTVIIAELEHAHSEWTSRPWFYGRLFFPDRPEGYVAATRMLGRYADYRKEAVRHRMIGAILTAETWERECKEIYNNLPEFARW